MNCPDLKSLAQRMRSFPDLKVIVPARDGRSSRQLPPRPQPECQETSPPSVSFARNGSWHAPGTRAGRHPRWLVELVEAAPRFAELLRFASDHPDAPPDLSVQHDDYLYGTPKR
jgi:hypothetical protein